MSPTWEKAFLHGHPLTANPIACVAGLASFDLLVSAESEESRLRIEQTHQRCLQHWVDRYPRQLLRPRVQGTVAAFDCPGVAQLTPQLKQACLARGLLIRPRGSVLYWIPPYTITDSQLEQAYANLMAALVDVGIIRQEAEALLNH